MNFINNINFLFKFLSYTSKEFSPCKIYQILEFEKLKIKKKSIEKKLFSVKFRKKK